MLQRSYRLGELARLVSADVRGDTACVVDGIMTLKNAGPSQLSFLDNKRYLKYLPQTRAAAIILRPEYLDRTPCNALVTSDPYLAFAKLAKLFEQPKRTALGIHPTVIVGEGCTIHPSASIAAFCVLEAGTSIEEGVVIGAACNLGENVTIGANSCLAARVTLYAGTVIGQRVLIHSGSVIGSDGFGLARDGEGWLKIPQLGRACIGNDVEIGANVTIDRGALEDTVIEDGVKLDNQIQIGHNVYIGRNTAIAGCTGIAGSTRIGKNCMIGGGVCINGHIEIADNVAITGMSSVVHSIRTPGIYSSTLSVQARGEWTKNSARFHQLDKFVRRLKGIELLFMRRK